MHKFRSRNGGRGFASRVDVAIVRAMDPKADTFRDAVVAAFEAAMLVRCTAGRAAVGRNSAPFLSQVSKNSRAAPIADAVTPDAGGWDAAGWDAVVEFSQAPAAHRLVQLLLKTGAPVSHDTYMAGNRHRYRVHRVVAPAAASDHLNDAWRRGYLELCGRPGAYRSQRQCWHRDRLAAAAWRAALLAAGRAKMPLLGVRVADLDTAAVLVRASRVLQVPVELRNRPGGPLLTMTDEDAVARLAEMSGLDDVLNAQAAA
jgi:hypothetical protein